MKKVAQSHLRGLQWPGNAPPNHKMLCPHYFSQHVLNGWQHHHAEPHAWGRAPTFQATVPTIMSVQKTDFEHIPFLKLFPSDLPYTPEHL